MLDMCFEEPVQMEAHTKEIEIQLAADEDVDRLLGGG
jgi:hypothetical protein